MSRRGLAAALPLFVSLAGGALAEEIRRWTDPSGRVHFSNVGPAGERPPPPPSPEAEPLPRLRAGEGTDDPYGALADEEFSAFVTRRREALRRELRDLRSRERAIDSELEELRRARERAFREHGQKLQGVNRPPAAKPSEREEELLEEKKKLGERAREVRKEFEGFAESARKRYGGLPGWWLPLD